MTMKLKDVSCPSCGAAMKVTPNAKVISCEYCNHDFVLKEETQQDGLNFAEKAGYEFEKGRMRAKREEKEKNEKIVGICPYCHQTISIPMYYEKYGKDTVCEKCAKTVDAEYCHYLWWAETSVERSPNKAIEYYKKILAIDPDSTLAKEGLQIAKYHLENYVYISAVANIELGDEPVISGTLELKKDMMSFIQIDGTKDVYSYSKMSDTVYYSGNHITFSYPLGVRVYGTSFNKEVSFNTLSGKEIAEFIIKAKNGKYPPIG